MKKSIIICILTVVFALNLQSQENTTNYNKYFHFGGYLHYLMNKHSTEFSSLSGCVSCNPGFTGGSGNGFAIGGLIEFPLNDNNLSLGLRAGYSMRNSDFFQEEKIGNAINKGISAPNVTNLTVEHSLLSELSTIDLEANINYSIWNSLRLSLGLKGAMLINKTFSQKEKILSPSGIVFDDTKTIERNKYTNMEISNATPFLLYFAPAISYDFRVGSGLAIAPELRLEFPINNLVDEGWKPIAMNFGVAVRIPYIPKKPTRDTTIYIRDTNTVQGNEIAADEVIKLKETNTTEDMQEYPEYFLATKYINETYERVLPKIDNAVPSTSLSCYGIDSFGNELPASDKVEVIIEEIAIEESFPILPHIYFPQNSSDLSATRMKLLSNTDINNFDEQKVEWSTMEVYYNTLNIVAYRMKQNPNSKLEIIGCNNETDEEKNNKALSKSRAEAVRDYLQNVCRINGNRLIVKSRNLPEKYSNNTTDDGKEENRRVELFSTNTEILKPLTLSEIHKTANPPTIRIMPNIESERPLEYTEVLIEQNGKEIRKYEQILPNKHIDWVVETKPIPQLEDPVNIHLTAKGKNGQVSKTTKSINIEQRTIQKKKFEMMDDKRIERYSLILFDFNKTTITPQHREAIKLVKSRIQPNSTISVMGYTDRMGNPEYNMRLSLERANNVAKLITENSERINILGKGGESLLYNNNLPEGRSYNRTVRIIVETPIDNK